MIRLYTAFTNEIDDSEVAIREITEQLNLSKTMLKNSVGIVQFHLEFIQTGVYQALVEALPFDLVGCVTTSVGVNGQYGDFALSVALVTSDDVKLTVRTLQNLDKKPRERIADELALLFTELSESETPKMVMSFMPIFEHFSGDDLVAVVNALPESFPLFGTIALNGVNYGDGPEAFLVSNGINYSHTIMAFVAFYGDFEPKFRVNTSFDFEETFGEVAEITDSDGAVLKKVNGMAAVDFLIKQGGITDRSDITGDTNVVSSIPSILTRKDGSKVARAFFGIVDGDPDSVFSAGNLEVGSKISFSCLDGEKTLLSAEKLITEISASNERNFIAFSCAARAWSFGSKYLEEVKKIALLSDEYRKRNMPIEYSISYSAGEICPVLNEKGEFVNTLHNFTLVSCSFG